MEADTKARLSQTELLLYGLVAVGIARKANPLSSPAGLSKCSIQQQCSSRKEKHGERRQRKAASRSFPLPSPLFQASFSLNSVHNFGGGIYNDPDTDSSVVGMGEDATFETNVALSLNDILADEKGFSFYGS